MSRRCQKKRRSSPKQGSYGSGYRTQQATRSRICLAKNHQIKTRLHTVRTLELSQKKEASYEQIFSSGFGEKTFENSTIQASTRTGTVIKDTTPLKGTKQKSKEYRYAMSVSDGTATAELQPGGRKFLS